MKKVIFVCTSNVCRSPAAVALAVKWAIDNGRNDEFSFCSRGISTDFEPEGSEPSDLSVQVLQNDFGIDIRAHRSQMLLDEDVSTAFVIVALTESHRSCIISDFPKAEGKCLRMPEDIPDPWHAPYHVYHKCIHFMNSLMPKLFAKIEKGLLQDDSAPEMSLQILQIIDTMICNNGLEFPWTCPSCYFINKTSVSFCTVCAEENPTYCAKIAAELIANRTSEFSNIELLIASSLLPPPSPTTKKLIAVLHLIGSKNPSISLSERAVQEARIAIDNGADGIFLIAGEAHLLPSEILCCYGAIRTHYPSSYIGINFLLPLSLEILSSLPICLNALWVDYGVDRGGLNSYMLSLSQCLHSPGCTAITCWKGDVFGGFFFKGSNQQLPQSDERLLNYVHLAAGHFNVLTTSGPGTAQPILLQDLIRIHSACASRRRPFPPPLAIASGLTVDNIDSMIPYANYFIIGTGIERLSLSRDPSFHMFEKDAEVGRPVDIGHIDADLVRAIAAKIQSARVL